MILESRDAANILKNLTTGTVEFGKQLLGERWEKFAAEEKSMFIATLEALAKAQVAQLAGNQDAAACIKTLQVALKEWELSGKMEIVVIFKAVATQVFGLAGAFGGGALKSLLKI